MILNEKCLTLAGCSEKVAKEWIDPINQVLKDFGITNPKEVSAFLATITHESANFTKLRENLNYSAAGLASTWPNRYSVSKRGGKPNELAYQLHRKPEAIANNCYANRMGNGDEDSGDGWRYRGCGPMQHTGKDAAKWLNRTVGQRYNVDFIKHFELLSMPLYGMAGAAQYWIEVVRPHIVDIMDNDKTSIKVFMDICSDLVNRGRITSKVGDAIGFEDRLKRFQTFVKIFNDFKEQPVEKPVEKKYTGHGKPAEAIDAWGSE